MNSNYEKMKDSMREFFLQYNQEKMIQKFSLKHDSSYLYLTFISHEYRIDRITGEIQWSDDAFKTMKNSDYNEAMTIYDVLCYSKDNCHLAHEYVNLNSISSLKTGNLIRNDSFFQHTASFFNGKMTELRNACEAISGNALEKGDLAYELALFPFLPLIIRFWEADEDFPASLQILVDKNILDYMHYETLMFALTHLFHRLEEEIINEKG